MDIYEILSKTRRGGTVVVIHQKNKSVNSRGMKIIMTIVLLIINEKCKSESVI